MNGRYLLLLLWLEMEQYIIIIMMGKSPLRESDFLEIFKHISLDFVLFNFFLQLLEIGEMLSQQ